MKKTNSRVVYFITFIIIACLGISRTNAELERLQHPTKNKDGSIDFLVVGDWGRKGAYNQSHMGKIGERKNVSFIISTGDNFYDNGLSSVDDPLFHESFTKVFTAKSLQKQWYNVLGNHDYRGDVEAQLNPSLTRIDSRWLCKRSFIVNTGNADIIFVDTTPFINEYFVDPKGRKYDWRGVTPRENYTGKVLKELEIALKSSEAEWKIVIAHHPIKSAGSHRDTQELIDQLNPVLEANDVDFYINGHDHCLQHISSKESKIQYFTSGGGSKAWNGEMEKNKDGLEFYYDGQGFMAVKLAPNKAQIKFYDIFGKVLHKFNVSKQNSAMTCRI
ncbi:acid phosphatase [Ranunculus cassubicifolius]